MQPLKYNAEHQVRQVIPSSRLPEARRNLPAEVNFVTGIKRLGFLGLGGGGGEGGSSSYCMLVQGLRTIG